MPPRTEIMVPEEIDSTYEREHFYSLLKTVLQIATDAKTLGTEAKSMILSHQEICKRDRDDREKQIVEIKTAINDVAKEVRTKVNQGLTWSIGILIVCVGFLIARYVLTGQHP